MIRIIKTILLVMAMMTPSLAFAEGLNQGTSTTNSIYIDQVGDSSTITIKQEGQGNGIGTEAQKLNIQGNNQAVDIYQKGNNNTINGSILDAANITYNLDITGDGNTILYDVGVAASVAGSETNLTITGDTNDLKFTQGNISSATGATQNITINGDLNKYISTINTDDVVNTLNVAGDSNDITMTQNGFPGKNVEMNLTGDNNDVIINQKSTLNVDTIKLDSTSSDSVITINQCNAGGC